VAVESAGTYASLHLAPDRKPRKHPPLSFLQAGCPSCRPTNSIKALKAISTEGSKIHIGFTSLEPAHPGSPGQRATKRVCVCVQLPTSAVNVALPAFAAAASLLLSAVQQSIDISYPPGAQQQTHRSGM